MPNLRDLYLSSLTPKFGIGSKSSSFQQKSKIMNPHQHQIHANESSNHEELTMFTFEDEEFFKKEKIKKENGFHTSITFPFDLNRLPNFQNEEIIRVRPTKNFTFDIIQQEEDELHWKKHFNNNEHFQQASNHRSPCFDITNMFQNVKLEDGSSSSTTPAFTPEDEIDEPFSSYFNEEEEDDDDDMSIEGLRLHFRTCFTCGVQWNEEQASLDCGECGGYALTRPCPDCDGHCLTTWTRNLDQSHSLGKASWNGLCSHSKNSTTGKKSSCNSSSKRLMNLKTIKKSLI